MPTDEELSRLVNAVTRFTDNGTIDKRPSGVLTVCVMPHHMKELKSALGPFRALVKS